MWAWFLVISITAILVSTSIRLIRGRMRVERVRHEMLTRELEQARQIQLAWLPGDSLQHSSVDIAAVNEPANHISGDFYNWFELPDGRTVVIIGDVTGHGMSAAFLMATTQLLVRTTMLRVGDPGRCMREINRQLCQQVFNGQFVTMLILVINSADQCMDVAVSGHPAPLLVENGTPTSIPITPQMVLGVDRDAEYPTERFGLSPNAQLILYTDGVPDALGPDGSRLHTKGFLQLCAARQSSASELLDSIMAGLTRFRAKRELCDDLTVVTIQFQPSPAETSELLPV